MALLFLSLSFLNFCSFSENGGVAITDAANYATLQPSSEQNKGTSVCLLPIHFGKKSIILALY
jgi:hypothetical protein